MRIAGAQRARMTAAPWLRAMRGKQFTTASLPTSSIVNITQPIAKPIVRATSGCHEWKCGRQTKDASRYVKKICTFSFWLLHRFLAFILETSKLENLETLLVTWSDLCWALTNSIIALPASRGIELSASAHYSHLRVLLASHARRGMELFTSSQLSSSARRSHLIRWSSPPPRIIWTPSKNRSGFLPSPLLGLRGFSLNFQVRFLTNNLLMTFWFSSPISRLGWESFHRPLSPWSSLSALITCGRSLGERWCIPRLTETPSTVDLETAP